MTYIVLLIIAVIMLVILVLANYLFRPRFPAKVTCWFCGEKTKVAYENRNCWDCPLCEQYNGFDKDGNCNKPMPAQYDERLNNRVGCLEDEFIGGHDILCEKCTQNQLLKVKQLANFVPYDEKHYDYEVDAFNRQLEKVYRLCLQCEVKVQQELQFQNEAISSRRGHLDDSRSFMENAMGETTFLHSSYSDKRLNNFIVASVVLHTVSLVCSLLVGVKEISLNGEQTWQKQLLFLHPVLLWLDVNVQWLATVGLVAGLMAKLCLGKYRLHVIDAVSCPVWLLVLLSQTGYLSLPETGFMYHICSLVLNSVTCAVCLYINRRKRNQTSVSMVRMSLDNSVSDTGSSVFSFSSVSQDQKSEVELRLQGQRSEVESRSQDERSEIESLSHVTSTTDPEKIVRAYAKVDSVNPNEDMLLSHGTDLLKENVNVDSTTTELNAFSLGKPAIKRNDSGVFSIGSQSSFASNLSNQSVLQNLHSRSFGQGRPLLLPATFTHASTVDRHRSSPVSQYGLFSVHRTETPPPNFTDRPPSPLLPSAFVATSLFSSQRHSFTPERPSSPVVMSFGELPFSNMPLQIDRLSQYSTATTGCGSFSVARQNDSVTRQHKPVARKRLDVVEYSDGEDDNLSDITSISRRCPVERTTDSKLRRKENGDKVAWWRHPGFIGFVLGGSVAANIILGSQMTWFNNS